MNEPEILVRRRAPPYYIIGRYVYDVLDLVQNYSYNAATAMAYIWRSGQKPGADAAEDLRKAADHLLAEASRIEALPRSVPPCHDQSHGEL